MLQQDDRDTSRHPGHLRRQHPAVREPVVLQGKCRRGQCHDGRIMVPDCPRAGGERVQGLGRLCAPCG